METGVVSGLLGVLVTAVGLLFLVAGLGKLFALARSRRSLSFLRIVPKPLRNAASILLPIAEIVGGVGLVAGTRVGVIFTLLIILVTTIVAAFAVAQRLEVPCDCFRFARSGNLSLGTLVRNGLLACIAATPLLYPVSPSSFTVVAVATAVLAIYVCAEAWHARSLVRRK